MNTKTLQAYAEVKILWTKMCRAQGVDPESHFVAGFPLTAPYASKYNQAMARYQAAILEERAAQERSGASNSCSNIH
jgi:malate synthase